MRNKARRPLGVRLLAGVFLGIGCVGCLFLPLTFVSGDGFAAGEALLRPLVASDAWVSFDVHAVYVLWLAAYVLYIWIGYGLWRLREWARKAVLWILGLTAIATLVGMLIFARPVWLMLPVLAGMAIPTGWQVWYLRRPVVRDAFAGNFLPTTGISAPPSPKRRSKMVWIAGTAVVCFALFAGTLFYVVDRVFRESEVYAGALHQASDCPALVGALGTFEPHGMVSGNLNENGNEGDAALSIPVVGANGGRGDLEVRATRAGGTWTINHLAFERANQEIEIVTDGTMHCGAGRKE